MAVGALCSLAPLERASRLGPPRHRQPDAAGAQLVAARPGRAPPGRAPAWPHSNHMGLLGLRLAPGLKADLVEWARGSAERVRWCESYVTHRLPYHTRPSVPGPAMALLAGAGAGLLPAATFQRERVPDVPRLSSSLRVRDRAGAAPGHVSAQGEAMGSAADLPPSVPHADLPARAPAFFGPWDPGAWRHGSISLSGTSGHCPCHTRSLHPANGPGSVRPGLTTSSASDQRRLVSRSYRHLALGLAPAAQARYPMAGFPTLFKVAVLDRPVKAAGLDRVARLHDGSAATALVKARGATVHAQPAPTRPRPIRADSSTSDHDLVHVRSAPLGLPVLYESRAGPSRSRPSTLLHGWLPDPASGGCSGPPGDGGGPRSRRPATRRLGRHCPREGLG